MSNLFQSCELLYCFNFNENVNLSWLDVLFTYELWNYRIEWERQKYAMEFINSNLNRTIYFLVNVAKDIIANMK